MLLTNRRISVACRGFSVVTIAISMLLFAQPTVRAATDIWLGNTSANWLDNNWFGVGANSPPINGDALQFTVAGTSGTTLNNNLAADTIISGITLNGNNSAGIFTLNGNEIT